MIRCYVSTELFKYFELLPGLRARGWVKDVKISIMTMRNDSVPGLRARDDQRPRKYRLKRVLGDRGEPKEE